MGYMEGFGRNQGCLCSKGLWRGSCCSRVFVIYCPPPRDPAPFLLHPNSFFFLLLFKCFDSSYSELWEGEEGGELRLGKGPLLSEPEGEAGRGVTWVQQMWRGRERKRRGQGWETIPPHSSSQLFFLLLPRNIKVLLLSRASGLRERTNASVCQADGAQFILNSEYFTSFFFCLPAWSKVCAHHSEQSKGDAQKHNLFLWAYE